MCKTDGVKLGGPKRGGVRGRQRRWGDERRATSGTRVRCKGKEKGKERGDGEEEREERNPGTVCGYAGQGELQSVSCQRSTRSRERSGGQRATTIAG
jgi:hypothetical protein